MQTDDKKEKIILHSPSFRKCLLDIKELRHITPFFFQQSIKKNGIKTFLSLLFWKSLG